MDVISFHKHQKKDGKWREVMVDFDDSVTDVTKLRYVLSPGDTYASSLLLKSAVRTRSTVTDSKLTTECVIEHGESLNQISITLYQSN